MPSKYEATVALGRAMFGHAQLGDRRRRERLVTTFEQMRRHPGGTLPDKMSSPADLKGLYRLCRCEAVTHAALVAALRIYTLARIAAHDGPVLVVMTPRNPTTRRWDRWPRIWARSGTGTHRGYICHNVIALDATTGAVLGLLDQILHCRDDVPDDETLTELRERDTRESLLWLRGAGKLPGDPRLIDVADQGASTFELLEHETHNGRRFVIRNGKTRKVYAGHAAVGPTYYLKEHVQSLPELGRFTMDAQPQKGRKARQAAEFTVRGGPVLLLRPHARCGRHGDDPLPLYVVYVREMKPPRGEKPIEWMLLTNEPVRTFQDAWRVVGWYERRWVVEEYHKALKTGCQIEDLQFTAVERLQPKPS